MSDTKKELLDDEIAAASGGAGGFIGGGNYEGMRITTGISKACPRYEQGSNFYSKQILAISGTCGACKHLTRLDGWHLCDIPGNY